MGVFLQPPFWSARYSPAMAPHAVSVLVSGPIAEPLDLATAKLYARLRSSDTSLDTLVTGYIKTARAKVEQDTGLALITQTRDVYFDAFTETLPAPSRPLQSVTSFKYFDSAGVQQTLDATNYLVDVASGRLGLSSTGAWPSDLRDFQPFVLRVVVGWADAAALPQPFKDAVGFLVDAYVNKGPLDLYEDTIAPYRLVTVA